MPVIHRSQALYWLIGGRRLVSVAGAHGKTTSTGMIVTALQGARAPTRTSSTAASSRSSARRAAPGRRPVRHRGRRVGRHVPALRHLGRAHHEHRPRPPRPLRLGGGVRRRVRAVRRQGPRGRRDLLRRPGCRARGRAASRTANVVTFGEADARGRARHRHRDRRARVASRSPTRRVGVGAPRGPRRAQRHQRRRRRGGADDRSATTSSPRSAPSRASRAPCAASSCTASSAASASSTTTRTTRPRWPRRSPRRARSWGTGASSRSSSRTRTRARSSCTGSSPRCSNRSPITRSMLDVYGAREDPVPGVTGELVSGAFADPAHVHYVADWQEAADYTAARRPRRRLRHHARLRQRLPDHPAGARGPRAHGAPQSGSGVARFRGVGMRRPTPLPAPERKPPEPMAESRRGRDRSDRDGRGEVSSRPGRRPARAAAIGADPSPAANGAVAARPAARPNRSRRAPRRSRSWRRARRLGDSAPAGRGTGVRHRRPASPAPRRPCPELAGTAAETPSEPDPVRLRDVWRASRATPQGAARRGAPLHRARAPPPRRLDRGRGIPARPRPRARSEPPTARCSRSRTSASSGRSSSTRRRSRRRSPTRSARRCRAWTRAR